MAAFKLNSFSGIRPRFPESLLPEMAATQALNCDFAYGELRSTKDGFLLNNMTNTPQSIYTDTGLTFYTWPNDVNAVRSPLVSDTYNRMYYTDGSAFRVADRTGARINGGVPGTSFKVGVPKPSTAPVLSVSLPVVNPDTSNITFRFHYELNSVKYQEQGIAPIYIGNNQYRFTLPAMAAQVEFGSFEQFPDVGSTGAIYKALDTGKLYVWSIGWGYYESNTDGTPSNAKPVLRMTAVSKATGEQQFDLYSNATAATGLYRLTISNDSGAATYTATLAIGAQEADKEARAYIYTYVNTYNEEGPPSAPTIVSTGVTVDVNVQVVKDSDAGYVPIKGIRVYRTPTGSSIADYFFVQEIPVLSGGPVFTLNDNVNAAALNEPIASTNYYMPPDNLVGLMSLPNGILCAWRGNEVWFSEAYKPWAWPPSYVKPLTNTIVGGVAHGAGAVITTLAEPYLISGVSPDSMTASKINLSQAGVSKRSIASVDGVVMYASNDGIVVLTGGSASLAQSARFFTRDVWRQRYGAGLSTMNFSVWDGRLVVFSSTAAFTPFMIRFDEADGTMTDLPQLVAKCAFISQVSDQFYYAKGTGLYQFNGGTAQSAVWTSREEVLPVPMNFGFAQAVTEGNWTINFYASGELKHSQTVAAGVTNFRLPSGFLSDRWKIELMGQGRFRELRVAQTASELSRV